MKKKPSTSKKFNSHSRVRIQDVVDYAAASPAVKKEMDKVMKDVLDSPGSFDVVLLFGHKPLAALGEVANEMLGAQVSLNQQMKDMQQAIDNIESELKSVDFAKFTKAGQKAMKMEASKEMRKFIADVTAELPALAHKIDHLTGAFDKIDSNIQGVVKKLDKLEETRKDTLHDLIVAASAARELLRRYDADFIPAAQATFDASKDVADGHFLEVLKKRREDFVDRRTIIEGARAGAGIAGEQIGQMAEVMADARKRIQDIQHNSKNEWKAMLVAAGVAGGAIAALPSPGEIADAAGMKKKKPASRKRHPDSHKPR